MEASHDLQPGQRLARGVMRLMHELGHASIREMVPAPGLRGDVTVLTSTGEIWIIECKSCRADFISDRKWQGYLDYCDRFFWAVDTAFPPELLPDDSGLILADGFGAEIARMAAKTPLAGARRARILRDFARTAALRLHGLHDPIGVSGAS